MERYGVRPSVCLSRCSSRRATLTQPVAGNWSAVARAGARRSAAGSAMFAARRRDLTFLAHELDVFDSQSLLKILYIYCSSAVYRQKPSSVIVEYYAVLPGDAVGR